MSNLELLVEMMNRYAKSMDVESSLSWALPQILTSITAEAGSFFIHDKDKNILSCSVCVGPVNIKGLQLQPTQGLVGKVFSSKKSELVEDVSQSDQHLSKVDDKTGFVTKSLMTVPVVFGGEIFGCLQAINCQKKDFFDSNDLSTFEGLAVNLAMALKNISLSGQLLQDKLIEKDIADAKHAQRVLFPDIDSYDFIAGGVQPYRELSGDFIDYFSFESKIGFIQGDVSGKGIPATILMSRCAALFRLFAKQNLPADEIAIRINQEIFDHGSDDRFITCILGWFNEDNTIDFVNCGHNQLLHLSVDKVFEFISSAPPLGVVGGKDFIPQIESILIKNGDSVYVSTDGITEAKIKEKEIGMLGLAEIAKRQNGLSAPERYNQVKDFLSCEAVLLHDDATLLVILPRR